jgi:hypothetical protein
VALLRWGVASFRDSDGGRGTGSAQRPACPSSRQSQDRNVASGSESGGPPLSPARDVTLVSDPSAHPGPLLGRSGGGMGQCPLSPSDEPGVCADRRTGGMCLCPGMREGVVSSFRPRSPGGERGDPAKGGPPFSAGRKSLWSCASRCRGVLCRRETLAERGGEASSSEEVRGILAIGRSVSRGMTRSILQKG